jgi:hypothetical protein
VSPAEATAGFFEARAATMYARAVAIGRLVR